MSRSMLKFSSLVFVLALGARAMGAEQLFVKDIPKASIVTKAEVIKSLLVNGDKEVFYKCQQQELSDKVTLRNK